MNSFPDIIYRRIIKFIFPLNELNNTKINNTINNVLTKSAYCNRCGENNKTRNCIYCNTILYYYCKSCNYCTGDILICCYDSYKNNGMYHYNI